MFRIGARCKRRGWARGTALIEATMTMVVLSVLGLVMFKMALNITTPRQWTLQQTLTDAYMTYEKAYAQRVPFERLIADDSPWPVFPRKAEEDVEIGRLPGGRPLTGKVVRTRVADSNNLPAYGGNGTAATNPAGMQVWKVQSIIRYKIGSLDYVKTRTVIRVQ
jgi:hypothetical protein